MSQQTLPAAPRIPPVAPLFLRSLAISLAITAAALVPFLGGNWGAFLSRFTRAAHWPNLGPIAEAGPAVQIHLATVAGAIAIAIVLLCGVKGSRTHRTLGWAWSLLMLLTAISALFIRAPSGLPNIAGVGLLHVFSAGTLILLPWAIWRARRHDVRAHAKAMTGFVAGGFMVAGLFAFIPGRLLWQVFFG